MQLKYSILGGLLLLLLGSRANAQSEIQQNEIKKVYNFFRDNPPWESTPDSTMLITFAYLVEVKKDPSENPRVITLTATDSLAYRVFPKYRFLETVNFGAFMKDRNSATFVFPVLLEIHGSKRFNGEFTYIMEKAMSLFSEPNRQPSDISKYIYFPPFMERLNKRPGH
ncbi:MAG TPA: hypothetical protein VGD90_02615 [Sphingobacteriaceae bacterium]